jgi:hypothetical protein
MSSSHEVFYLHIQGEQRGPYTVRHIDHLLNSGLITEDTLFWREGLEQWQPVTQLVVKREVKKDWRRLAIPGGVFILVALLLRLFGPITVDGWRETNQHEFSRHAAYWRARDIVRNQCVPKGGLVRFSEFAKAEVTLSENHSAGVLLRGELTEPSGKTRPASWKVELKYDAPIAEWTGVKAQEAAAP